MPLHAAASVYCWLAQVMSYISMNRRQRAKLINWHERLSSKPTVLENDNI